MAATGGIRAGAAYVELGTHDKALMRGLNAAKAKLDTFAKGATTAGLALTGAFALPAAGIARAVQSFADAGSEIYDMTRRTGASAEALSALKYAADQSGASIGTLETGILKGQRAIAEAAGGNKAAAASLAALGLSAGELIALNPAAQFAAIGDRLAGIADPTLRAAAAVDIFGKSGTELLPMLEGGAAGLQAAYRDAERLGLIFSGEAAESADALGDALGILSAQGAKLTQNVGQALAPAITTFASRLSDALAPALDFVRANPWLVQGAAAMVASLGAAGLASLALGGGLKLLSFGLGGLQAGMKAFALPLRAAVAGFGAAKIAIAALLSPTALLVAAIATIGAALVLSTDTGRAALSALGNYFAELAETATATIGGIKDALAAGDLQLAARVLWAGLRLAWAQGIEPLRQLWAGFKTSFLKIGSEAFYGVARAWETVANWFWRAFPDFTAGIASTWRRLMKWLADAWIEVLGLFDRSIDVDLAKKLNADQLDAELAHIRKKATQTDAEHNADLAANLAQLGTDRAEALQAIDAAAADATARAAAELAAARAELDAVTKQANLAAKAKREAGAAAATDATAGGLAAALSSAVDKAAGTLSLAGGFNAFAAELAGGATLSNRIARAVEKTAANTGAIKGTVGEALSFG